MTTMTVDLLTRGAAVAALAVSSLVLAGCGEDAVDAGAATTVEEIQADPGSYVGQDLTVLGEVEELLSPFAFTITSPADPTSEPILVVDAGDWSDLEPAAPVQVEGQLRAALVLVDLEDELGRDLDDDLYAEWEGLTYIVSDHAERADT